MISNNDKKIDKEFCSTLSKTYNIHSTLCEYLFSCGINTEDKAKDFFLCDVKSLKDSFSLSGMSEAVAKIKSAISNENRILIFGDYDADGVCSSAILYGVIKELGGNVNVYIPTREDGYGITEDAIEYISSEISPDLIITVDCGISAYEEIEIIKDIGMDIIVTDHHNVPSKLPECVVINPKLDKDNVELSHLCGAGVAFKLAEALNSDFAYKYIDLACIATVADSVELFFENRNIVKLGLLAMQQNPRPYITAFLESNNKITCIDTEEISFYLAPLINAAGRMDTANIAFDYVLSDNIESARESFKILSELNDRRKKICEEYTEKLSKKVIKNQAFDRRCIVVKSKNIPKGIIGIVAARLTETYHKPSLIFTEKDGVYYGSGRSIETINIYDIMNASRQLYITFGGHAMACGVSIESDNFDEFLSNTFSELEKLPAISFLQEKRYDIKLQENELNMDVAYQMKKLSPFGVGFRKPKILLETYKVKSFSFANNPKYMKVKATDDVFAVTFCGDRYINNFLCNKKIELLLQLDTYKNFLNVTLQDVDCDCKIENIDEDILHSKYVEQLYFKIEEDACGVINDHEFSKRLDICLENIYGSAIVINTKKGYEYFENNILTKLKNKHNILQNCFLYPTECKSQNCIIFGGSLAVNFEEYKNVFFVDEIMSNNFIKQIKNRSAANIFALNRKSDMSFLAEVDLSKKTFSKIFLDIKSVISNQTLALDVLRWYNIVYKNKDSGVSVLQYTVAMLTFLQLKIFEFDKSSGQVFLTDKKCELTDSVFYNNLLNRR